MTDHRYEMRQVARQTGIHPHLIRAWERRYGAVKPQRTASNRRRYTDADVARLILLRRATAMGYRISQVADMDAPSLQGLLARGPQSPRPGTENLDKVLCGQGYEAVGRLDARALQQTLESGAVTLPRSRLLSGVITPLLARVGTAWAAGGLTIAAEHMATAVVRSFLGDMLAEAIGRPGGQGPVVVVAAPAGNWHELGALSLALATADAGCTPLYLGADLPASEIAGAVALRAAAGAAVSITHHIAIENAVGELRRLRRFLSPAVALFAGGGDHAAVARATADLDIRWCADFDQYRRGLGALSAASAPGDAITPPA